MDTTRNKVKFNTFAVSFIIYSLYYHARFLQNIKESVLFYPSVFISQLSATHLLCSHRLLQWLGIHHRHPQFSFDTTHYNRQTTTLTFQIYFPLLVLYCLLKQQLKMYFKKAETKCSYFLSDPENLHKQHSSIDTAYPEITYYYSPFIFTVYLLCVIVAFWIYVHYMLKSFHFSLHCSHNHQVPPIYTKSLKNAMQLKLASQNEAYLIAPDYCLSM